jgi:hypothetical protein
MVRRIALVFSHVLLPYVYTRGFLEFRKRNRQQARQRKESDNKLVNSLQTFAAKHLETIQDYYNISKRITGIRYVSAGVDKSVRYVF